MKQFRSLKVLTVETDERRNVALDELLSMAAVGRVGKITIVSAFSDALKEQRQQTEGQVSLL